MNPATQKLLDAIAGSGAPLPGGMNAAPWREDVAVDDAVEIWLAAGIPDSTLEAEAKKTKIENPVDAGGVVRTDGVGQLRPNSAVMPRPRSGFGELEAAKREIVELESEVASQAILLEACLPHLKDWLGVFDDGRPSAADAARRLRSLIATLEATAKVEGGRRWVRMGELAIEELT
ncbi:MAG: hypothetical protein HRU00_14075 [Myxococcales bacterium]|nr:hypothetical protein [Myxococcales bacterium]